MTLRIERWSIASATIAMLAAAPAAFAQSTTGNPPASSSNSELPEVQVIQAEPKAEDKPPQPEAPKVVTKKKPKPAPVAAAPKPAPQPAPQTAPIESYDTQAADIGPIEPEPDGAANVGNNPIYGSPAARGAAARAAVSATTPANPTQVLPSELEKFSSAATNLSPEFLKQNQPRNINEALTRVPGVVVINDDAAAHHGGIGVRGSPARRSRKVLVMEDGHTSNLALWLDPSVHFWVPVERLESVEVLRGTVITHGPNNNFGVINGRNLSPFGPAETVVSTAIGFTKTRRGSFTPIEEVGDDGEIEFGDETVGRGSETDISARWHVHTRQNSGNVGMVASYTGANVQGAWDSERLRFNDFYGALGWKGTSSDLVVSSSYSRQRDNYDEQNFLGEAEIETNSEVVANQIAQGQLAGFAESQFKQLKHCKTCFAPDSVLNNYNGEIWRGQIVHNTYLDDDTTITTRLYAGQHTRDRYQLISFGSDMSEGKGSMPIFGEEEDGESAVFFGENTMFGRLRTFRHLGTEVRGEWANRNVLGFNQDIQAGIRYEYNDMTNRNFLGLDGEILKNGDKSGATIFDRELDANAVSAFMQTNVTVASDFNVVPGIRFEWYQASRTNRVIAREESEAGGAEDDDIPAGACIGVDDCLEIDGLVRNPDRRNESYSNFHALPGIAFAYTGLKRTTLFGGYHRGMSTGVLRNEDFPVNDEIGDNFNLGIRSTAIKGFNYEVAGFHQILHDYQFGASFSDASDRSFGRADKVEISGVELQGRLNSQPFTGGSLNFFGDAAYTYSRGKFKDLTMPDGESFNGNRIPEVPLQVAALSLGVEQKAGWRWDASVTWTYRGSFFTDEGNTGYGLGGEVECEIDECEIEEAGEDGKVPSIWLLSARFNLDIGDTGASIFVAGDNLLDEFYVSDREDGMKPGLGRTFWTGLKYKF